MSTRKEFLTSVVRSIIALVLTVFLFLFLPTELTVLAVFSGVCTLLLVATSVLTFLDLPHGTGRSPKRPTRY